MGILGPDNDPFLRMGFTSAMSNLVVNAIKRGRNGENMVDVRRSDGTVMPLQPEECKIIGNVVDEARGAEAPLQVLKVVAGIVIDKKQYGG